MNSLFDFLPDIAIFISKLVIREFRDWREKDSLADGRIFIKEMNEAISRLKINSCR